MSDTDGQAVGVNLAQVRERFVSAERELQEAVSALRGLEAASRQLGEARASFTESASTLSALEGRMANATETLLSGATNLRTAIEAIDRSDPARLRAELEVQNAALAQGLSTMQRALIEAIFQMKSDVATSLASLPARVRSELEVQNAALVQALSAMQRALLEAVFQMKSDVAGSLGSLKQDFATSEKNELTAIAAGNEQVLSILQAALRAQGSSITDALRAHSHATSEGLQRAGAAREAARREGRMLAIVGAVLAAGALVSVWIAR